MLDVKRVVMLTVVGVFWSLVFAYFTSIPKPEADPSMVVRFGDQFFAFGCVYNLTTIVQICLGLMNK